MRVYASISEFYYFNKILQIPILFLHKLIKKNIKDIFEDLINLRQIKQYQTLSNIVTSIHDHANSILTGGSEFRLKKDWLEIYWPSGEYEYIKLLKENKFEEFYDEFEHYISKEFKDEIIKDLIKESILINKKMMRLPFENKNEFINSNFNVIECFKSMKENTNYNLKKGNYIQKIIKDDFTDVNWEDWMREVIWYGHRSGKYSCKVVEQDKKNKSIEIKNKKDSNIIGNSFII